MVYKSKFEQNVAKAFKLAGVRFEYEPEVVRFLQPEKERKYTPDFRIFTKKGSVFIETKGKLTLADRQKMIWVRDQNPKKRFVFIFMNADNKLTRRSKTTYGEWATKNEFVWFDFRKGLPTEGWTSGT